MGNTCRFCECNIRSSMHGEPPIVGSRSPTGGFENKRIGRSLGIKVSDSAAPPDLDNGVEKLSGLSKEAATPPKENGNDSASAPKSGSQPSPAAPSPKKSKAPPPPESADPPKDSSSSPPPPPPPKKSRPAPPPPKNRSPPTPSTSTPPPPSDRPPAPTRSPPPPITYTPSRPPPSIGTPTLRRPPPVNSNDTRDSHPGTGLGHNRLPIILGVVAGVFITVFVFIIIMVLKRRKKSNNTHPGILVPPKDLPGPSNNSSNLSSQPNQGSVDRDKGYGRSDSHVIGGSQVCFTYEEIMQMTGGFSEQNIIGEGGFGLVYKGQMPDGKLVAVKNLKTGGGQGDREFKAEVEIISRVHHRHLVSLVGYCIFQNNRVLIYEFLPNNTLQHHLHGRGMPALDWPKRQKIAVGAAKGLAYLHEYCHPKIIHRDIKSANILLDNDFEAQVADFGLARLHNDTNTHVSTRVMGTFGYLAPEYAQSGKLTDKSDVYSFGVVLLELITGHKAVDSNRPQGDESLVEWARPHLLRILGNGELGDLVDPCLENNYVKSELFRMMEAAIACTRRSARKRPRMGQVVRVLDVEDEMFDLTNDVRYEHSAIYTSGEYQNHIQTFRRMAFGSGNSSDFPFSDEFMSNPYSSGRLINQHSGRSINQQPDRLINQNSTRSMNQYSGPSTSQHSGLSTAQHSGQSTNNPPLDRSSNQHSDLPSREEYNSNQHPFGRPPNISLTNNRDK